MDESVPDTPVSDKKIIHSTPPTAVKDDAEYETVATLPLPMHHIQPLATQSLTPTSQRLTQPTQIIEVPHSAKSNIQVAASSPLGPASSPTRPTPLGGRLSNLMAPPGTRFCPPASAGPAKRTPVINLDDDGPTYLGGSSDEDAHTTRSTDIKPSMFTKSSRSPEKVLNSPVGANSSSMDRFKEITASAVYNPGAKRPASQMDPTPKGIPVKKIRQSGPSRAQPVEVNVVSLQDIEDYQTRVKVERMLRVMPQKSVRTCMQALLFKRGNYEDALDHLANTDEHDAIGSSEDELNTTQQAEHIAPAKQNIKARGKIQDKWSAMNLQKNLASQRTQSLSQIQIQPSEEELKPRRRLIRGPKARASSPSPAPSDTPPKKKPGRLVQGRKQPSPARSESPEAPLIITDDSDSAADEPFATGESEISVLKFINTCQAVELADLAATTEDVAKIIISHRPFRILDAVRAVPAPTSENAKPKGARGRKTPKPIGDKIVDKCLDMWVGYEAVDSLVATCEELGRPVAAEMKKWGVDIFGKRDGELELVSIDRESHDSGIGTPASQPTDEDSDGPASGSRRSRFISQPSIMNENLKMKDYQVVGINWLSLLFDKKLSCILADDMGLGKTCQVIAFLAHLYEKGIKGPHLVVVPSSTIENWLREFQKFCPTLSVMPYYAGQAERAQIRQTIEDNRDDINVIITTYTVAKAKVDAHFLRNMNFCVCVYDEGHMLKSSTSVLYEKLIRISARFRLLLTGTPLQNNLQELASLLGFILPKVFQERKEDLQYIFANKAKTVDDSHSTLLSAQRIERAKSMLKPFVLRRKKHQVIDLPRKISHVEYCQLNSAQKEIYEHEQEEVRQLLADRAAGKKTGNRSANILMKLRQAAIHPLLYRRHYTDTILSRMAKACLKEEQWSQSNPNIIFEELQAYNDFECHSLCINHPNSLGKFALKNDEWMNSGKVDKLCELLKRFKENGDRTLVFSQFTMVMDILEHVLETLHLEFVRLDGRTNVEDRQSILDAFHERTDIPVFLLSTKAGGAGINLACANKVVIFDSSFNPQEDVQAENRAHRVGQTQEVEVIRLVTKDTIEEQIYALGQTKLALDQAVAGDETDNKKGEEAGMKVVEDMVLANLGQDKATTTA
ncbi:DEAD/DEAH box helicase [Aspergillus clavatus NRRL 1]|uniref:SNF2 family helicase/ATPase, putative n=1 Tax=Aspergillus clavatus (strain ATCC 1007 / CBS 513.65 / DSM 816 / NCTC 3887 / NRRL 1 / QM 1276 / 107) TaxID=344612 RepID=A1CJW0_ASPCL|nr:SNF2 family helicase/ATPase, putative [Aspergillus clavatus NRRL 1]EAW09434.1 SNF2 family helicase/ATPase, putative [Aspergillus clavatus NRRL 1]